MGSDQSTLSHNPQHSRRPSFLPNCAQVPETIKTACNKCDKQDPSNQNDSSFSRKSNVAFDISQYPQKTITTIFVEADDGTRIEIQYNVSEQGDLTCGWLVSETIRQFAKLQLPDLQRNGSLIMLQTKDGTITLDYWLSELQRSVSALKDGTVLKPFYTDSSAQVGKDKLDLRNFQILKLLGTGGTAKVYLARRNDTGKFYAIKVITKKDLIDKDKEELLFNERNIMVRLNHPFLTKLHYAFQTDEQLFLVMDFYPGGELFYHLSQRKNLSEADAKIYMGQIILAINYLHKNNIIYRDLKPENILLDIDGHLHLTDFGLCKLTDSREQLNFTFCGSPEYMAPEIIKKTGYNCNADFYSLGMLVYEMVVGQPPFKWKTHRDLFQKILDNQIPFPTNMSPKLKSFLSALLHKDPNERLGAKHGLSEIVNHPWCADLDFVKIASKKVRPPIQPDIYELNFHSDFLNEKILFGDDLVPQLNGSNNGQLDFYENYTEGKDEKMFMRFANFSFYSHIDDPYEKFDDSIFGNAEEEASRDQIKMGSFLLHDHSTIGSPQDTRYNRKPDTSSPGTSYLRQQTHHQNSNFAQNPTHLPSNIFGSPISNDDHHTDDIASQNMSYLKNSSADRARMYGTDITTIQSPTNEKNFKLHPIALLNEHGGQSPGFNRTEDSHFDVSFKNDYSVGYDNHHPVPFHSKSPHHYSQVQEGYNSLNSHRFSK